MEKQLENTVEKNQNNKQVNKKQIMMKPIEQVELINWVKIGSQQASVSLWHRPQKQHIPFLKNSAGLTHLLCCLSPKENFDNLKTLCEKITFNFLNIPLDGANLPFLSQKKTKEAITETLLSLIQLIENKQSQVRILIHCAAGIHRTGVVSYSLLRFLGNDPQKAMQLIKEMREDTYKGVGENRIQFAEKCIVEPYLQKMSIEQYEEKFGQIDISQFQNSKNQKKNQKDCEEQEEVEETKQ